MTGDEIITISIEDKDKNSQQVTAFYKLIHLTLQKENFI